MNIVTPVPTTIVFTTANVNTEAARRDNVQRETIPQTNGVENSAAEAGLGSESDRVKTAGQQPQPVTYERPQSNPSQNANPQNSGLDQDNAEDPSAGRENAESKQQEQQQQAEQQEIKELEARDQEVRAHEQAHATVGGQYAGSPSYEFENGPDGKQYAIGGEVSIDISKENTPEETVRKMQQVRAAALAPSEPSPADLRVASEATQIAAEARVDIAEQRTAEAAQAVSESFRGNSPAEQSAEPGVNGSPIDATNTDPQVAGPELDDIVQGIDSGSPTRSLNEDPVAEAAGLETDAERFRQRLASRDVSVLKAESVISNFYQNVASPRPDIQQQTA